MRTQKIVLASGVLLVALIVFVFVQAETNTTITIRWLIAHEPSEVFVRAEQAFATDLASRTNGKFSVEFLVPDDVGFEKEVPNKAIFEMMERGEIDLVSMNIDSIIASSRTDLEILHLPYLFRDYASADNIFDGPVGARLLSILEEIAPAHALAFTYSGGMRVVASSKGPLALPEDLKGLRINTWGDHIMRNNLSSLGAVPVQVPIGGGKELIDAGLSDGVELPYSRAEGAFGANITHILEMNHVLFLSALLASEKFYATLSEEEQATLVAAAQAAAKIERADSITYGEAVKSDLQERGVVISTLSTAARATFEQWGETVRAGFAASPRGRALITDILEVQQK